MLQYVGKGKRDFHKDPLLPQSRLGWEFSLYTSGKCTLLNNDEPVEFEAPLLWVSSPDSLHGWRSPASDPITEVMVLHFSDVPPPIKQLCKGLRTSYKVNDAFIKQYSAIFASLQDRYGKADWVNKLSAEKELLEICLMILQLEKNVPVRCDSHYYQELVAHAKSIARSRTKTPLSVEEIAAMLGISAGHLRRVFQQELNQSPSEVFREIRLDVARQLMLETPISLSELSRYCGFSSQGAFTRLFKQQYSMTPREYKNLHA